MNPIAQAYELLNRQRADAAVAMLEEGGRAGDADCWVELAVWHLSGNLVPRDLKKTREYFRLASGAGHERARSIYIALLANGTGGPADWQAAVELLRDRSAEDEDSALQLRLLNKMTLDSRGRPPRRYTPRAAQ